MERGEGTGRKGFLRHRYVKTVGRFKGTHTQRYGIYARTLKRYGQVITYPGNYLPKTQTRFKNKGVYTIKAKELKAILGKISKFGNFTLAVTLENRKNVLQIAFAYTSSYLSYRIPNTAPDFKANTSLKSLLDIMKHVQPSESITISDSGDNINICRNIAGITNPIPKLTDDFVVRNLPEWTESIGIGSEIFKTAEKMNKIPLNFGLNRELPLNQIHLTPKYIEIASTRMVWRVPVSIPFLTQTNYIIPQCLDYIGKPEGCQIAKDKEDVFWVIWYLENGEYAKKSILGDYPKVSNIIPVNTTQMFKLSAPALLLEKFKTPNCLDPMTPEEGGGVIWFKILSQNAINVMLIIDKKVIDLGNFPASVGDVKAGMKIGFTASTVAYAFKLGYTIVKVTGENTPAIFTNGAGLIVRMPVKVS